MYFVFIDEAGTPGYTNGRTPEGYFTLAGLVVKGNRILDLEKGLRRLKDIFDLHPDDEFKWGGKYSKVGFDFDTFCLYRENMFNLINSYSETIIASVLDKEESYKKNYINDHYELYQQALYFIMERLHKWYDDNGIIRAPAIFVIDSRKNNKESNLDDKLADAYKRALRTGTYYYNGFPYFSETPFFATSDRSAGLQLTDYCAGPIQQYFSTGKDKWYNLLRTNIRKSPEGKITGYGIKFFPGRPTIPL